LVDVTLVLRYQSWHTKRCCLMSHWYADIKVGTPKIVFFLLFYLMSHWYADIKVGTPKIVFLCSSSPVSLPRGRSFFAHLFRWTNSRLACPADPRLSSGGICYTLQTPSGAAFPLRRSSSPRSRAPLAHSTGTVT
jgi:hypothetical protein